MYHKQKGTEINRTAHSHVLTMSCQVICEPMLIQTSTLQAPDYLEFLFWQFKTNILGQV